MARPTINRSQKFHDWAQGWFAIAGIFAVIGGGILYIMERRDKPRIILQPRATVIGMDSAKASGTLEAVLMQVSVAIENRGARSLILHCAAIDIIGLSGDELHHKTYTDDLAGTSLLPPPMGNQTWTKCVDGFEKTRREEEERLLLERRQSDQWVDPPLPTPAPKSGARYRDFFMEPGEITTKTWEQRVPCTYDAVRIIFKLPKPDSTHDYETKIVVPVADVCANERHISVHLFGTVTPGDKAETDSDAAPTQDGEAEQG